MQSGVLSTTGQQGLAQFGNDKPRACCTTRARRGICRQNAAYTDQRFRVVCVLLQE